MTDTTSIAKATAATVHAMFNAERYVDKRSKLLLKPGGKVKELGVYQKEGVLLSLSDSAVVVKWPGYSMNPGSKFSGLTSTIKTHVTVYLIDDITRDYSSMYGSGVLIKAGVLTDYDTRPTKPTNKEQ